MSYSDFERNIPAAQLAKMREREAAMARRDKMCRRWEESERLLGVLRTIPAHTEPLKDEVVSSWYSKVEHRALAMPTGVDRASAYFHKRYPEQAERYGPAFIEKQEKAEGMPALSRATFLNTDLFGAILGGDYGLGHQLVYYRPEAAFYYYDVRVEAFCPVSEAKIQLMASNILVKAAEACSQKVNTRSLLEDFRKPPVLREIVYKARAILEVDRTYFEGEHGKTRLVEGYRLDPTSEPAHRKYVKRAIQALPGARLRLSDVHAWYVEYCQRVHLPTLTPTEAKRSLAEVIEEIHGLGLRHDVADPQTGKHQHGWIGLSCLPV